MRTDANDPCDGGLKDDDKVWMQHVIKLIGCVPPYWKTIYGGKNGVHEHQCNTTEQLKKLSRYLPMKNEFGTREILKLYQPPCTQLRVLANANTDRYSKTNILKIKFRFRLSQNNASYF